MRGALDRSAVHLATMPDLEYRNDALGVIDRVDDSVISLANSVSVGVARQLFTAGRARVIAQSPNPIDDTLPVALLSNAVEFPRSRALDIDPISCHAA